MVTKGVVSLFDSDENKISHYSKGQSIVIPAAMVNYKIVSEQSSEVFITRSDKRIIKPLSEIMQQKNVKFGTSGLRSHESKLDRAVMTALVKASLILEQQRSAYLPGQKIMVGRDYRPSSWPLQSMVEKALKECGYQMIDAGAVPTQAVAWGAKQAKVPALMITASHNPLDENGVKGYRLGGKEILKSDELDLAQVMIDITDDIYFESKSQQNNIEEKENDEKIKMLFIKRYLNRYSSQSLKGLKVGVWLYRSVGPGLMFEVLQGLGADVVTFGDENEFLSVDTEAIPTEIVNNLNEKIKEHDLDFVVAFDPDADRPILLHQKMGFIHGGQLGMLVARILKIKKVVVPFTLTRAVELSGWFDQVKRTDVGSPYVIEGMNELTPQNKFSELDGSFVKNNNSLVVGWEGNGGFLTQDLMTRDSFLPLLEVLVAYNKDPESLVKMFKELSSYVYKSDKVAGFPTSDTKKLITSLSEPRWAQDNLKELGEVSEVRKFKGAIIIIFKDEARLVLRPSGNTPDLKIYVDAVNQGADKRADQLISWAKNKAPALAKNIK
ncbi:hypothetical protein BVY03_05720 [bacterium K02(2017)]|nr:hypothetical protein BVY03_05720 [bacterium K02(2017)]